MCDSKHSPGRFILVLSFAFIYGLVDSTITVSPPYPPPVPNPDQDIIILTPSKFYVGQSNLVSIKSRAPIAKLTIITKHEGIEDFSFTIDPEPISPSVLEWYQYDVNYQIPYQSDEDPTLSVRIEFRVHVCEQTECRSTKLVNLTQIQQIVSSTVVILGETDKPIYKPGELVRIRFLAVNPSPIDTTQSVLPQHVVYRDEEGRMMLKRVDSQQQQSKQTKFFMFGDKFDQVSITDPNGNRVKQWLNLTALEAANLNFRLLPDAGQGSWFIQAQIGHQFEHLKIKVKKYVLPRFLVTIEPPKQLFVDSKQAEFLVCAKYTNGHPMKGTVHVSFCVCDMYDLSREYNMNSGQNEDDDGYARRRLWYRDRLTADQKSKKSLEDLLDNPTCPTDRYAPRTRSCLTRSQYLLPNGCTTFNLSMDTYLKPGHQFRPYMAKPIVCVKVEEDGTGSVVTKCEIGNQITTRQRQLKIEFPTSYRPGLPILGQIRFKSDQLQMPKSGSKVKIIVEEFNMRCGWFVEPLKVKNHLYVTMVELNSQGLAHVVIPPILAPIRLRIQAQIVDPESDKLIPNMKPSDALNLDLHIQASPTITVSDHIMEPWITLDGGAIQVWSEDMTFVPKCPGELKLKLVANRPLANRTLFAESVVRRKHLILSFPPDTVGSNWGECQDRDDQLGHYTCPSPNSNEIICLDGWQGDDCLKPICARQCHQLGGTCARPNECLCRPGWNGTNCDQCLIRSGCKHGRCELGDDCVCESGWQGYYCSQRVIHFEHVNPEEDETLTTGTTTNPEKPNPDVKENKSPEKDTSLKPKRTLFEREISFQLDSQWGPEANVVLYFMDMTDQETRIVATSFRLEGLTKCTSDAIAAQQDSPTDAMSISPKSVDPGSKVRLTIIPHILNRNSSASIREIESNLSNTSDLCFVRISDTALDNYDGGSKNLIDFAYYANKLKQYGTGEQDSYRLPESNPEAFDLAGLQLSTSHSQIIVRPSFGPCTVASMLRSGQPGPMATMRDSDDAENSAIDIVEKPRLRDFFPEVWLFDVYPLRELSNPSHVQTNSVFKQRGVQLDLTVPDSITTWRALSFCTTQQSGMFIANPQTLLVSMPFFIDLTIPKEAKRGEILHLPLSVFVYDRPDKDQSSLNRCYEVSMTTELDPTDWLLIGANKYTGCVCTGEKQTFIMSLMPKRLGHLNVTAQAFAFPNSLICMTESLIDQSKAKPLADKIRRSIQVVPEGIGAETSVGDILCLEDDQTSTEQRFVFNLPTFIIPGSLRGYVSYSDEVLGPALVNMDRLVKLPTGCGEQNMVLVAPNVFVLDYLLSTTQSNMTKYKNLIQKAKNHIQKGYTQQLKYRRTDGSFSAWGQSDASGSTWLTAFVLRVFNKATKLGLKFDFDEKIIFDDTIRYLLDQQDPLTGCFLEKGRLIHAGMQGSIGDKGSHILLTTYVSSVLWPIVPADKSLAKLRNETLGRVHTQCLESTKSIDWTNVSTSVLVQYAHNMMLMNPDSELASKLVELVRGRSQISASDSMAKMYWPSQPDAEGHDSYGSRDIETTAYAYLTLAKTDLPSSELLPIVRWLTSQQKAQGGFHSTQDTVLGLEVISDFAKRLGLSKKSKNQNDVNVSFAIEPLGYSKTELFGLEQRGYLSRQQIPVNNSEQIALNVWNLTSTHSSTEQCLAVQLVLLYNLPDPVHEDQSYFDVTTSVTQSMAQPDKSCTKADLLICIRPNLNLNKPSSSLESGMLLISVTMVTGWTPSESLISSHMNSSSVEAVKRIEIGENGQVAIYFDGFSQIEADRMGGWSNIKRCVTVSMHQTVYIEDAKPATVTVKDYYMSERMVETSYVLNECREAWHINARPVNSPDKQVTTPSTTTESNTTPSPVLECPICELDKLIQPQLIDALYKIRCHTSDNLIFVKPISKESDQINTTVSLFYFGGMIANWNTTVNRTLMSHCLCEPLDRLEPLIVYSPSRLNIYAGDPQIKLIQSVTNRPETRPFSSGDNSVFVVPASKILKFVEPLVSQWNQKTDDKQCKHFETLVKYIKRKVAE